MKIKRNLISASKNLDPKRYRVSIFGSARVKKKNDKEYRGIYDLAKMLGSRGIDVVTGGGPGLMEAANSGHIAGSKKNNSQSIGLGIKLPMEQKFNKSIDKQETFMRFTSRLDEFMLLSNAVVVGNGGIGTLLELFYTWQLVQVNHICHIPIILMGDIWPGLIKWMKDGPLEHAYFTKEDLNLVFIVKNADEAMKIIEKNYEDFKKNGKVKGNFCINSQEYMKRLKG